MTNRAMMGIVATVLLGFIGANAAQELDYQYLTYDALLKTHVDEHGLVDYKALKKTPQPLNAYLDSMTTASESQFKAWSEAQQIAFLANLYNAFTLKLIVDHYPVKSIKDIGGIFNGPWDQPVVRLFGTTMTLNNLEHDILRKQYNEPRLHMALVCAAKGCPPLRNEPYTGERLNEQLADQSKVYLASPAGMQLDRANGAVSISSIFKWYGGDFPSVPAFIAAYTGQNVDGLKIRYLTYDWTLNER